MSKPVTAAPVGPYHVDEMTIEDAMDISMWRAPGPWAVQDSLETPRPDEGFWVVRDSGNQLVGYCCFGIKARPLGLSAAPGRLDVALGMAPEYTGRHLSQEFATAVVRHSLQVAESRRLRCAVAEWNERVVGPPRRSGSHSWVSTGQGRPQHTTYYVYEQ